MTGEQLSASLATAGRQASEWFSGLPVKKLHNLLCGLFILWVLYGLVQLIITLIPASPIEVPESAATGIANPAAQQQSVDIASLQALQLFGEAGVTEQPVEAEPQPVVDEEAINAEKTRLNLTLEGIVYSPAQQDSAAVIVHGGKQELFLVGDEIPVGNNVSLSRVMLDRVILDNNGNLESLWLYDEEKDAQRIATRNSRPVERAAIRDRIADMREDDNITDMAEDYRERLFQNPASLAEVIRISPAQEQGEMVGYRISPGKDREQFERLGLKTNDVVTSINGIELNEPSNALEIYKLMRTATEASFTIDRNGQPVEILVSLGDQ